MATDKLVDFDHVTDYISREAAISEIMSEPTDAHYPSWYVEKLKQIPAADVRPVPPGGIGEMSDGYHTFNGLYYQRMVLFAALVKQNKDSAWKSHRHEDGELCFGGGWFIVGLDTPKGSYTYHYEDKDWDLFDCEELPVGKHWDGHTEDDVTRLLSLPEMRPVVRMAKLKPCPFCGKPAKATITTFDDAAVVRIYCSDCRTVEKSDRVKCGCTFDEMKNVIDNVSVQWNRRAKNWLIKGD